MAIRDEDAVRDGYTPADGTPFIPGAKQILGLDKPQTGVIQGTGQIKTFNSLGKDLGITEWNGISDKPDGWYLPQRQLDVAIIVETKSENENIGKKEFEIELIKNVKIANKRYERIIGLLYNGIDVRVFKNETEITGMDGLSTSLQNKKYYTALFNDNKIDKMHIYKVSQRINDTLHFKFGMNDLKHRMIFTACALVVQRYYPKNGINTQKNQDYDIVHGWVSNKLALAINTDNNRERNPNLKLNILLEEFNKVNVSITNRNGNITDSLNSFIDDVCEIANLVNSDYWNGEDVMAIFFNEFNRYGGKTDAGQVFTPDHITSFMYRVINVSKKDKVLDATCGSGAFLVKAMCNMIKEAGGVNSKDAKIIKSCRLYGIEMYRDIYALACANMLIHKDGKTNLEMLDARSDTASKWIKWEELPLPAEYDDEGNEIREAHEGKPRNITKVLMNPPFEKKYGCLQIVKNVLDSVPEGTLCAFILPDKKLEKNLTDKKHGNKILKDHTLTTIIKLPENLFPKKGITTSIFIFESGTPQDGKNIIGYYIEDDGLETVKNQGRQDIRNRWKDIENYWIQAIHDGYEPKFKTRQIIDPSKHLSYQKPKKDIVICEEEIYKTVLDYEIYQSAMEKKELSELLLQKVLYGSEIKCNANEIGIMFGV